MAHNLEKEQIEFYLESSSRTVIKIAEVFISYDTIRVLITAWDTFKKRVVFRERLKTDIISPQQRAELEELF